MAMAQTITINKASYPDVPYVLLNKTDGTGQAKFVDTSDATANSNDIVANKAAYINGELVSGSLPLLDMLTSSDFAEASDAVQVTCQISERSYIEGGALTIPIDKAVAASAIGVSAEKLSPSSLVLGISGTFTADADASASDIAEGKTAYVDGKKITGTAKPDIATSAEIQAAFTRTFG